MIKLLSFIDFKGLLNYRSISFLNNPVFFLSTFEYGFFFKQFVLVWMPTMNGKRIMKEDWSEVKAI